MSYSQSLDQKFYENTFDCMYTFFHILQINTDSDQGSHCDAVCLYGPIPDVCYKDCITTGTLTAHIPNGPIQTTFFSYLAPFFIFKCQSNSMFCSWQILYAAFLIKSIAPQQRTLVQGLYGKKVGRVSDYCSNIQSVTLLLLFLPSSFLIARL